MYDMSPQITYNSKYLINLENVNLQSTEIIDRKHYYLDIISQKPHMSCFITLKGKDKIFYTFINKYTIW